VNAELERMWKEAVVAHFIIFRKLPGGKLLKSSIRIVDVAADIRTQHLTNTNQKHYRLSQLTCLRNGIMNGLYTIIACE
jgi:hypothetical protein